MFQIPVLNHRARDSKVRFFAWGMCLSGVRILLFPQETPQLALTGGMLWHESREHMGLGVQLVAYSQSPCSCICNLFTKHGESGCSAGLISRAFSWPADKSNFVQSRASFPAVNISFRREILGFSGGILFLYFMKSPCSLKSGLEHQ